jgi:hypothetical protein
MPVMQGTQPTDFERLAVVVVMGFRLGAASFTSGDRQITARDGSLHESASPSLRSFYWALVTGGVSLTISLANLV